MVKRLTKDKDAELNGYIQEMIDSGVDESEIQSFTNEFVSKYGIDDAMPEKKNEVQGLNVEVGTSVGSSVKSPVSSIKTEQNVGLSPSGKKGIDILRGASVKPISPTKTAIPQTPKKKKSQVEELRKSIQQKVAFGEPLTTDEVSEVRKIASNVFLPLDGLKDGEVNAVLAGAQNKQNQQLISKSRNDQYQKQLKDRIVSGEILPEDIKGMYDISGFAPPDMNFEKLANDWNAENLKIKQKIDSELLNESTKIDEYIIDLDNKIKNIESKQLKKEIENGSTPESQIEIEEKSATDGAISNLKSIKYKAQKYLDYLSEKAIDESKGEIIKRVNKIQGIRDEKGLVKDVVSLEQVVDDYISTQPTEKQNLLLRKKSYLVESLVASEYIIPKANEVFYQKAESIISDVPQSAKQLFKRVTGEIDVKDGEEKYYDTQQQFAIANNAASLYFMDEVARTNQAFESIVSLPNVRNAVGGKLDVLKQQYDSGQISVMDYKLKRLQALSLNPQTSEYAKEYFRKIQNAQERFISKIDKFLQSKVPDFAKFTEVDESGNIVSIAGMKPMKFTQKMTELQTAKTESLNEAASMYATDIENRAIERRGELFEDGVGSWMYSGFKKGTHRFVEGMAKWAYDNTGISAFDDVRKASKQLGYIASIPYESKEVQNIMDIEAGDYSKALNLYYITGMASESAPYMLAAMAAGVLTGGLAEGALLGMGLSEGIGAAITLSRAGRIAQKTIAAISGGTSDAYLNMTANYNDLIKEGYSKEQAKQIAFDAFKNELPVDILSGAVEMDALFSATSKPTIKNIIKGGASKAGSIFIEEPIQEVYQGYSLEQAKGTNQSLSDYAFFDKEGFNNLMGGFAGGLGTGAVTNAMGIAKNALSWNRLYNVSTADMQNAVRYAGLTQMVATTSEMQNSINLDLLKSAQSIAQEEYQKIPNNEKAQKEKTKNEYVNRTIAYEYAKSINKAIQNGTNIEDVHEHYKAHNEAISKAYSTLASLANEKNKPMYQKQADYYASLAQKSEIGQQTAIYSLITPKGRVFITEQTAKTLAEGSIQQKNDAFNKAVRAGDIVGIQVVDDSKTAQSLIKKFDDAKLSQQLEVQQSQGGATEVGQPTQTNVQTPVEGTTEIQTTEGVVDDPNISPESTTITPQAGVVGGENPALKDVESTAKALEVSLKEGGKIDEDGFQYRNEKKVFPIVDTFTQKMYEDYQRIVFEEEQKSPEQFVSEAYHKAKADGSNPKLVEAVEQLLGKPKEATPQAGVVGGEVEALAEAPLPILTKSKIDEIENEINERNYARTYSVGELGNRVEITTEIGGRKVAYTKDEINRANEIEKRLGDVANKANLEQIEKEELALNKSVLQRHLNELKAAAKSKEQAVEQSLQAGVVGANPALKDVESTAKALEGKDITTVISPTEINSLNKQLYNDLLNKQSELLSKGIKDFKNNPEWNAIKDKISFSEAIINNDSKAISEAYHKAKADGSNPQLVEAVEELLGKPKEATPQAGVVGGEVGIKNEGKAEAPTKENVTERLNINNPFYKKVEDALVKLGLIEKYNPETGTGDVVGGYAQQTTDGGFSVGKMLFSQDGSISYFDGDVKVSFDKNGNVISENTKEAKQKAVSLEIEGKKEQITNLEKRRDSEAFKYKEVTETDVLGNKKKGKRLKTEQELKESTDKINATIDKAKSELSDLEQSLQATPQAGSVVGGDVVEPKGYADATDAYKATELGSSEDAKNKKQALVEQAETEEGKKFVESEVSKLEKNDDGTITVFRSGTLQEGHNPATTSRKMAETIASERKKQGLSSDIIEVRVNPSDISVVVKGIESEVFVKVDKTNKERLDKNTLQKQKTKSELLAEKDEVQKELDKTIKALADSEKAFNDGTYPFSENVFNDSNKKQKLKIKNLEWQLSKIEQALQATPKEETKQPIEIDESTPFDLSTALQTKKEEQDAIQKQSTTEEVLLNERPEMGLQEVGEGNAQVEAVAEQGSQEEKVEFAPLQFTPKNFIEELIGVEGAVALSGINEQQRQELIQDRLRTTTLTPQKEKEREIVKLVKSHNGMRRNARERIDVRGRIMRLVNDYNKEYPNQKLTFKSWYGDVKVTRPSFDRKQKSTYQKDLTVANLDLSNASLDETEKTFAERSDEFQRKFIELMDLGVQFEFRDAGNKKFSQKMLDDAMNDIENGIPSRRAAVVLNTVEKAIEENVITVGGSLTEGFQYIPLNLAIEETKEMKYEDELRNLSNAEIVAIYENEILAQKELDNIIQQEYEREFESDPNDEFGNVRQLAPRKKRDVISPNQEGDNQGQASEGIIEKTKNVENETPKTTTNRETGENLVGGNQENIPTDADGNRQREEEIAEDTPKQGEKGVGVVTGASTPVISEMDRAVLDAMKPTFEIEFIPNVKFLNTSAPLENKSSQDTVKRRYEIIKKLLECL